MAERCIDCVLNKKKIFFDIDKAVISAKKAAVQHGKTYAIYEEGKSICFTDAVTAIANGYTIIQMVSKYL